MEFVRRVTKSFYGNSLAAVDAVKIGVETGEVTTDNEANRRARRSHHEKDRQIQRRHPSGQVIVNVRHTCMCTLDQHFAIVLGFTHS